VNVDPVVRPIRLSARADENIRSRGATEQVVVEVIRTAPWVRAEVGWLEGRKP
jgi:hypothetical protein